ncbi:MIP family channel protein [Streptomyces sp. TP-A0874]|uniref:MIP family channel protein n=1 Tax=Streptomyces sp. TP-A0874 TaxID=549819 RepID=UPI000852A5EC|nr:MIP family channel protein [Streptomyces sp. TP-A0874]
MEKRAAVSEFLGTLLLVFFAVGAAVFGAEYIGSTGIALAFGFTLVALAFALGPISGCHINPAVTLGVWMAGRMPFHRAVEYWVAQVVGGIVGALLLYLVANQIPGLGISGAFGTNGYGYRSAVGVNTFGAFVAELVLTFLLVYVVLSVTHRIAVVRLAALPIGLAYAVTQLIGIPLTGASVNPARSIGPALFAGSQPLSQIWLFIIAPLVGGAIAALVHRTTHGAGQPLQDADWQTADAVAAGER